MNKFGNAIYWFTRIIAALILLQTLYFKFSGAEESVYIFTVAGMEPWGRIGIGILELIAAILMLVSRTVWLGALLAAGLMSGALLMHFTLLGIEIRGDGGYLFLLAVTVWACSLFCLYVNRERFLAFVRTTGKTS